VMSPCKYVGRCDAYEACVNMTNSEFQREICNGSDTEDRPCFKSFQEWEKVVSVARVA